MNSKSLFLIAGLSASVCLGPAWAQGSGGAGGGAGGAGSAGASGGTGATGGTSAGTAAGATSSTTAAPGSTSISTAADGATSSTGITTGTTGTTQGADAGTPDMSPTMPSRSVLNTERPPNTAPTPAGERAPLPSGLSVAPAQPGISPLSGLPVSEIPAVSRGTTPLGPNAASTGAATTPTGNTEMAAAARAPTTNDPGAIAAHPQTNPLIGMGTTTVVPTPPPALRTEATPATSINDSGQVWVAGHYSWVGGQWTWVDGAWQRPPGNDAVWVPGNYDAQSKRWTEGHWQTNTSLTTLDRDRTQDR